ncbi:hypothetical protein LCGC14_1363590 [marine sediment metagenome]|uniref:Uncharacterized protein n=1 Tax=marine sediment metagenome TaxID=412755 RepID=A0A0F9K7E9_9ZZZZ
MKIKVFGGLVHFKGKRYRAIIATTSQKRVIEIFKNKDIWMSLYEIRNYWTETVNKFEVALALSEPDTIFYTESFSYNKRNYIKLI